MIPDIGLMIGLYIITRMVVVIADDSQRSIPRLFAGGTILVALICMFDLLSKGSSVPHL